MIAMMSLLESFLPGRGFKRYEISNYAQPQLEAVHNMNYWHGADYLGLGAGAHSFCASESDGRRSGGVRWANVALPDQYIADASSTGKAEGWHEDLGVPELVFEFFFLGLRKLQGVDLAQFEQWFGSPAEAYYGPTLDSLIDGGFLERDGSRVWMSEQGLRVADSVIENFASPDSAPRKTGPTLR